jgi:hypothetical protein
MNGQVKRLAHFFWCATHVQQLEVRVLTQPDGGEV